MEKSISTWTRSWFVSIIHIPNHILFPLFNNRLHKLLRNNLHMLERVGVVIIFMLWLFIFFLSVKCGFHNYDMAMSIPEEPPTHISRLISNRAGIISNQRIKYGSY